MEHILDYLIVKTPKFKETMKLSEPTRHAQDSMSNFWATVTQMRPGGPELTRYAVSRTVNNLIYNDAPIMTVGDTVSKYQALPTSIDTKGLGLNAAATGVTGKMEWMKDVMKKISTQEGYTSHEFEKLASFFRSTWIQMPDETSSPRSMRPRYVKRDFERAGHSDSGFAQGGQAVENSRLNLKNADTDSCAEGSRTPLKSSALYMPFFSFSKYHENEISERDSRPSSALNSVKSTNERPDEMIEREYLRKRQKLFKAYEKAVIHGSSPLDEYQYHFDGDAESSKDRDSRNRSQVVTRCITKLRRRLQTKERHTEELEMDQPNCWPIIRVGQLWAWTIADAWLITSTSCAKSEAQSSFVYDVFEHLKRLAEEGDQVTGPATPGELLKMIVEHCVSAYEKQVNIGDEEPPQQRSIRQMFSDSINDTVRGETDLFRLFLKRDPPAEGLTTEKLQNATLDAAKLLYDIKDVRDELNILKNVANLQQRVQSDLEKSFTKGSNNNDERDLTATYVCDDIAELEKVAERINDALNTTITLHESEIANLEAIEAAKQGRKIFAFTVVTIIFVSAPIPSVVVQCRSRQEP
ncbi:hypothetical protein CkaCkLH20_04768 [Colletotrichum karsti]|uniref:Ankyrin repeat protein n=1 Tax=Colletotrichum karsti TaxID=1095194 RepID=A0A9P6LLD3_9PEZI|nr:uncharacterized protein CkaCkLH20_04768 [Colletotrichum karsti]KAF9877633.1 hypothetical protein CkaCkLH20_04768 [Colletotrichum karsti]